MLLEYDPEGDTLNVAFHFYEKLGHSKILDERRYIDYDDEGRIAGVLFLLCRKGIDLEGVPEPDRVAEGIRAFRAATAAFEPAPSSR